MMKFKAGDLIRRQSDIIPHWYWWYLVISPTNFGIKVLKIQSGSFLLIGFDIFHHYEIMSRPE